MEIVHMIMFTVNNTLKGLFPNPFLAIYNPPTMNPKLKNPHKAPQTCTETRDSPYASIKDIYTPPRKLLNVAKKINAKSPGIDLIAEMVPLMSSFFGPSCE